MALRAHARGTGQRGLRRRVGIDPIGLALATPSRTVGTVHLHHLDPGLLEVTREPGPVGAGALNTNPGQSAEGVHPAQEPAVTGWGGGELGIGELAAELIDY